MGTSREALIERYTGVLLSQPTSPFPLERLAQLYRERDGNLDKLIADFEQRANSEGVAQPTARLALALIYVQDGRFADARKALESVIAAKPKDPAPRLALAQLEKDQGDAGTARRQYEEALGLVPPQDRESTLRALITLCLDAKEFDAAKQYHRELLKVTQNSFFVRAELGRELLSRAEYTWAEKELRELVTAATGDRRTLAPALRDLGRALSKMNKADEALATLKQAWAAASGEPGLRKEILSLITDLYRADNRLGELVRLLESEPPRDRERLVQLGALYEETGNVDKALTTYRQALAGAGANVDLRLKVIHLLQGRGDLEEATTEYEALLRAAPHNVDYVFELCETLLQRGERVRALSRLAALEIRAAGDQDALARLADFYEKVDEKQKAIALLARLAALAPGDPTHLVDLGDRYYQQGDKKKALETWARIKVVVPNRAKALATLGDVYLEHDMTDEALEVLREAVQLEPQSIPYAKSYAGALERAATSGVGSSTAQTRYEAAYTLWDRLLARAGTDRGLAREARTHIVTLWGLMRQLEQRAAPLARRFAGTPRDVDAGRLLAEVQIRLRRLPDAEATLRSLSQLVPGDSDVLLTLERVLVLERNLPGAIATLEKLVQADPKRAREFYQRMAQYAAELYHDDEAITYAARAVQLSPDDAEGHKKLGEMYQKKQDTDKAIAEYRAALSKNDKLFPVYFDLAHLLLSRGEIDEADRLFRRVVRTAPDEDLVSQAARQSMQINLGRGELESLERDLLPVAIGNPRKTVYRRLLVELYGAMAYPLMQEVQGGLAAQAAQAKEKLRSIGTRAVKPLLDALADGTEAQQRIAVDLLAFVENKSAGPALFAFATGPAEQALRVRAMVACGALRDPSLLPKFESVLMPKQEPTLAPGDAITVAAAWGVARLGNSRATPLLVGLLRKGAPDVRALAAIGLGFLHERHSTAELARLAGSDDSGNMVRAATAFALGEIRAQEAAPILITLARDTAALPRQAAILALARLNAEGAARVIADGLLAEDAAVRESAVEGALVLTTGRYQPRADPLPVPDGPLDVRTVLAQTAPTGYAVEDRAAALVHLRPMLERAVRTALETSPERARVVADALLTRNGHRGFSPLTDGIDRLAPAARADAEAAAELIAKAALPGFVLLERHPASALRARAVQFLAGHTESEAQAAIVDALADPDVAVRRATLAAIGPAAGPSEIQAVASVLASSDRWPLRVRAAEALGRIGTKAAAHGADALATAAIQDPYALVREASVLALPQVDPRRATGTLSRVAERDPEERVRAVAKELQDRAR